MANGSLTIVTGLCGWILSAAAAAPASAASCLLCGSTAAAGPAPATAITIDVEAGIDFSRMALVTAGQGGIATLDPAGRRTVSGALIDLNAMPIEGVVTVHGEAGQPIEVLLPAQVTLSTTGGGSIELSDLTTSLGADPRIDQNGMLRFTFGGRLRVDGRSDGEFRANIPITVQYR
ncbi:MAG TPA: DUF4402 domain-containing protein [Allosphingosinicella sp.]|jgi:hypothetical protein